MYRCQICCNVSASGQHLLRHTIYRTVPPTEVRFKTRDSYGNIRTGSRIEPERKEIAKEVSLCRTCYEQVNSGVPLQAVVANRYMDPRGDDSFLQEYRKGNSPKNRIKEYTEDEIDNLLDDEANQPRRIPINHKIVEEQSPNMRRSAR